MSAAADRVVCWRLLPVCLFVVCCDGCGEKVCVVHKRSKMTVEAFVPSSASDQVFSPNLIVPNLDDNFHTQRKTNRIKQNRNEQWHFTTTIFLLSYYVVGVLSQPCTTTPHHSPARHSTARHTSVRTQWQTQTRISNLPLASKEPFKRRKLGMMIPLCWQSAD